MLDRILAVILLVGATYSLTFPVHQLPLSDVHDLSVQGLSHFLNIQGQFCTKFTIEERNLLFDRIECAIELHNQLVRLSKINGEQQFVAAVKKQADAANEQLLDIKQRIIDECNITETSRYIMNVEADHWIAGPDGNPYDILEELEEAVDDEGVVVCPKDKPFVVTGSDQCFNCEDTTPIFEYSTNQCVSCPTGMTLIGHVCICPVGQYLDEKKNFCVVQTVEEQASEIEPITVDPITTKVETSDPIEVDPITYKPETIDPKIVPHIAIEILPQAVKVADPSSNNKTLKDTDVESEEQQPSNQTQSANQIQFQTPPGVVATSTSTQPQQNNTNVTTQNEQINTTTTPVEQEEEEPENKKEGEIEEEEIEIEVDNDDNIQIQQDSLENDPSSSSDSKKAAPRDPSFMIRPSSSNPSALNRIIIEDASKLEKGNPCSEDIPFYTGNEPYLCISCPKSFDWNTKKCAKCPEGTTLIEHQCQ